MMDDHGIDKDLFSPEEDTEYAADEREHARRLASGAYNRDGLR